MLRTLYPLLAGTMLVSTPPLVSVSAMSFRPDERPCPRFFWDEDNDGFGDALNWIVSCDPLAGYVPDSTDCNDLDPLIGGPATYFADEDGDGYGDGTNPLPSCSWPPSYVDNDGDCDDTDETIFIGALCDDGNEDTFEDTYGPGCECKGHFGQLSARVILEGPYAGGFMNDALRVLGLLPLTEPYSSLGYSFVSGGGETTTPDVLAVSGPHAIVDWVVLELREADDMVNVKGSRAALLRRDGQIVDTDGSPLVELKASFGEFYLVIRHRNHLPAMSLIPSQLGEFPMQVDFTMPGSTFGPASQKTIGAVSALWAGDVTGNSQIKYTGFASDRDPILTAIGGIVPTNTVLGYRREDVTLDGVVKYTGSNNDRDLILQNIGGVVPTNVRNATMP